MAGRPELAAVAALPLETRSPATSAAESRITEPLSNCGYCLSHGARRAAVDSFRG